MRKHFLRCLLKLASSRVGQRSSIQSLMMNRLFPALFLDTINSYQRTAAIKAAIELDLFTAIGRKGGTLLPEAGTNTPDHHVWVKFARAMAPMTAVPAKKMARLVDKRPEQKLKVLDVAASHGMYGIEIARRNKRAEVVAIDWECVLAVAKENALKAGIDNRFSTIAGSAF